MSETFRSYKVYEILCDIEKVLSFFCVESDYDVDMGRALETASKSPVSLVILQSLMSMSLLMTVLKRSLSCPPNATARMFPERGIMTATNGSGMTDAQVRSFYGSR